MKNSLNRRRKPADKKEESQEPELLEEALKGDHQKKKVCL